MLTQKNAYEAWSQTLKHILREPTQEEITKLMPVDHPIDVENMTVGDYLDFKKNIWQAKQISDLVFLMRKETAYARRNEHHQVSNLFTNEELAAMSQATKEALKRRFDELNEAVKGA